MIPIDPTTNHPFESEDEAAIFALRQMRYGWREHRDPKRYFDYQSFKDIVTKDQPGIVRAIEAYECAIETLNAIFR